MGDATLPCISVMQPWASFIMGNAPYWPDVDWPTPKDVENRSWSTEHRGDLLIHASKGLDLSALEGLSLAEQWEFPRGVILGVVTLVDVVRNSDSPWAMRNQYHWLLSNPRPFVESVPLLGKLRIYQVPVAMLGGQYP